MKRHFEMTLYTLTYDCRDYYCDGMHLVGVFASEENAQTAQQDFVNQYPIRSDSEFSIGPIEIGQIYDGS